MKGQNRAARAAHQLLAKSKPKLPVDVHALAKRHAAVLEEQLPKEISGMLVPLDGKGTGMKWAIVVNANDSFQRRRFTMAHELGHLLLHRYSTTHADGRHQIRFRDSTSATGSVREEIEANQFAAELLMPEKSVRELIANLRLDVMDPDDDEKALTSFGTLANQFGVSKQAMTFRVANLGVG